MSGHEKVDEKASFMSGGAVVPAVQAGYVMKSIRIWFVYN